MKVLQQSLLWYANPTVSQGENTNIPGKERWFSHFIVVKYV